MAIVALKHIIRGQDLTGIDIDKSRLMLVLPLVDASGATGKDIDFEIDIQEQVRQEDGSNLPRWSSEERTELITIVRRLCTLVGIADPS